MEINLGRIALALLLASILGGCGGGSSTPAVGTANVSLTDGPGDDYDHVWVTVKAISFHIDANEVWSSSDASWQTTTLAEPVTIDLASLTNGALNQIFAGISLPVGSYKQIRLFMAGFDDLLTTSASNAGLTYNDQIDYTDAINTVHHVPLEIAYPTQGMQLNGNFNVTAGSSLNLAVDFNLEHDLVRFKHGTDYYFTMKPNLRYFDLNQSGAITGSVDITHLCTTTLSGCGYNMIVKAEILSADSSRHYDTRATTIKSDGSFSLYPLPSGATYDVLIRGRNVETMLVKAVTAPASSTPTHGAAALSNTAIPLTIDSTGEYFANFSGPLTPTSGWAVFQQTLPGGTEVPYEVRWGNTNPYSGKLEVPMALANGSLHVASYNAGNALAFSSVVPQEGNGNYSVATNGLAYYTLGSNVPVVSPGTNTVTSPLLFAPAAPTLASNVVAGTVSGTITQSTPGYYDSGYLVMSRFSNIEDTVDISGILTANAGAGGTYSFTPLPAGTASAHVPGAYYYAYLRVWNSAHPLITLKVIPINGFVDLRKISTVTGFNVTLQ